MSAAQPPAPGAVHGEAVDSAERPLRTVIVRLPDAGAGILTDSAGRFAFAGLPPGRHEIVGVKIDFLTVQDTVVVRSAETTHVRLRMAMAPLRVDTLPPRVARGAHDDREPAESETIDRVARVARLTPLRPTPANRAQRELRIWVGGGISIPMLLLRITDDGTRVRGEEILWLTEIIPDRGIDARWRAFMDSVPSWLRRQFHCGTVTTDTTHNPMAQRGLEDRLYAACRVQFTPEPDWRVVLAELERHHVWSLPDASELPVVVRRRQVNEEVIGFDGVGVTVEAWNGTRYRAYAIGNPDQQPFPEYRDAWSILRLVITFPTTHSPDSRQ